MKRILDVASMRKSDAAAIAAGTSGYVLMGRAAEAIFRAADWRAPVAVVCGKGNNGGDGCALAVCLAEAGIPCTLILPGERLSPDAEAWLRECGKRQVPSRTWAETESLAEYGSVADCIFGTGFRGRAEGEAARMIRLINESGAYVVSADINSGLEGDSGLAETAVRSDLTVSVGWFQPGHFLNRAMDLMGRKENREIGIPPLGPDRRLTEAEDVPEAFAPRTHSAHKGTYGYLGLVGGSLRYSGAIRLAAAANAAMRSGAGVVRAAVPRSLCGPLMPLILESTLFPLSDGEEGLQFRREEWEEMIRGLRVIALGMGMGDTEAAEEGLAFLREAFTGTLIIDADGLNALARILRREPGFLKGAEGRILLTPHPGEFSRLTGASVPEILRDGLFLAEAFAREHGVTVLLKGPATIVTDGTETRITDRGCPGMATAGSGDVLSGILAAVCAGPASLVRAAAAGAWIAGRAGEIAGARMGDISMTAGDTAQAVPEVLKEIFSTEKEA